MNGKAISSTSELDSMEMGQSVADQSGYEWRKHADGTWTSVKSGGRWTSYELLLSWGPFTKVAN